MLLDLDAVNGSVKSFSKAQRGGERGGEEFFAWHFGVALSVAVVLNGSEISFTDPSIASKSSRSHSNTLYYFILISINTKFCIANLNPYFIPEIWFLKEKFGDQFPTEAKVEQHHLSQ